MKHIISTLFVLPALLAAPAAEAVLIKRIEDINNQTVYTLKRKAVSGTPSGVLFATEGSGRLQAASSATAADPMAQWAIYHSDAEKGYFLYNIGTGMFATGNSKSQAVLTEEAVRVEPIFLPTAGYWVFDCGGYILGQEKDDKGKVIFTDNYTSSNYKEPGFCFSVGNDSQVAITDEQAKEIEAKIAAGRAAAIQRYTDFVASAKAMLDKTREAAYDGTYDTSELEMMLRHPERYSLSDFEDAYNRAATKRLPQYGYYRLRNTQRPSSTAANNTLAVRENGSVVSANFKNYAWNTATDGRQEDLCLFSLIPNDGDPWNVRLYHNASGQYINPSLSTSGKAWLNPNRSETRTLAIDPVGEFKRQFRLRVDDSYYLTVSGDADLVSWNQLETPMQFFFEKVKTVTVRTDANGYMPVILPCNVSVPETATAYVCTSVREGKAYFEEFTGSISGKIPFVLKAAPSTDVELTVEAEPAWHPCLMAGACVKAELPARQQIVSTPEGIGFEIREAGTVAPGTPYIIADGDAPLEVVMGHDPESDIETIDAACGRDLFSLQGIPVCDTPRPGLYIDAATHRVVRVK